MTPFDLEFLLILGGLGVTVGILAIPTRTTQDEMHQRAADAHERGYRPPPQRVNSGRDSEACEGDSGAADEGGFCAWLGSALASGGDGGGGGCCGGGGGC